MFSEAKSIGYTTHTDRCFRDIYTRYSYAFRFSQAGLPGNSLPTIKQFMRAIEALKPRGLAALIDVTHLPGREKGHPDLKDGGLMHKRVTHKALLRPEFAKFTDVEQEVYVFRLAR